MYNGEERQPTAEFADHYRLVEWPELLPFPPSQANHPRLPPTQDQTTTMVFLLSITMSVGVCVVALSKCSISHEYPVLRAVLIGE